MNFLIYISRFFFIQFGCLFLSSVCYSASFDCSKAATQVERLVCADPVLSELDTRLGLVFRQVRSNTQDKEGLKRAQFAWLGQLKDCPDALCLRTAYEKRIGELVQQDSASQSVMQTTPFVQPIEPNSRQDNHDYVQYKNKIGSGFEGMFVHYLRANPQAIDDKNIQKWWSDLKFRQEFRQYMNQEFKMAALCDKSKDDMANVVRNMDQERVDVSMNVLFKEYDFQKQCFPINVGTGDITISNPNNAVGVPRNFVLRLDGLDAANCLPLNRERAQLFLQKHMDSHGRGNRELLMDLHVKFDSSLANQLRNKVMAGQPIVARLDSVAFLDPSRDGRSEPDLVAVISNEQMENVLGERAKRKAEADKAETERQEQSRKAEAERQAQWRIEQAKVSRDRDIAALNARPLQVRLANYLTPGPVDLGLALANLRAARFRSLIQGKPGRVVMLIQAGSSGTTDVPTKWPGLLNVTAPDSTEFKASAWYLVQGMVSTGEGDGLPSSCLVATSSISCAKEYCQDLGDATMIVDRKLSTALGEKQ